jgi:hypothetical protein
MRGGISMEDNYEVKIQAYEIKIKHRENKIEKLEKTIEELENKIKLYEEEITNELNENNKKELSPEERKRLFEKQFHSVKWHQENGFLR